MLWFYIIMLIMCGILAMYMFIFSIRGDEDIINRMTALCVGIAAMMAVIWFFNQTIKGEPKPYQPYNYGPSYYYSTSY